MDAATLIVVLVLGMAVLSAVARSRDPEVRRRYDRWGVGHGGYSSRAAGWFGGDGRSEHGQAD